MGRAGVGTPWPEAAFTTLPLLPAQGTPLKYDSGGSSSSSKKHDVRSIIGSPGRTFHPVHPLDVIQDPRAMDRCYEETLKSRPSSVTSSGGSITRGAPVIVPELGKPRQSPLAYEDHTAAFSSHLPRGSPVSTRESTPRQQEGEWVCLGTLATPLTPSHSFRLQWQNCPRLILEVLLPGSPARLMFLEDQVALFCP